MMRNKENYMRIIETDRLLLRNITHDDKEDIFEFLSDEQTCLDDGGYHAEESMESKSFLDSMDFLVLGNEHYGIVLKSENKVIGMVHIMEAERGVKTKELGYLMNKAYRKKGYMKEAVKAVMEDLEKNENVKMFVMSAYEYNIPSIATMQSLGFLKEGRIYNAMNHPQKGLIHSVRYYKFIK